MSIQSPEWLILLALIPACYWLWPSSGVNNVLRISILFLLSLIACDLRIGSTKSGIDLWLLEDRSASIEESLEPRRRELEIIVERSRKSDDRIYYVDFAREVIERGKSDKGEFSSKRDQSNLKQAIEYILTQIDQSKTNRILLLSDGYSTEPLEGITEKLNNLQVALDYRLIEREYDADFSLERIKLPAHVLTGEGFLVEITVRGDVDAKVPYALVRGKEVVKQGLVNVEKGIGVIRFSDRLSTSGGMRYEVQIAPDQDAFPGNNTLEGWVEAKGTGTILLVTAFANDPLISVLKKLELNVRVVSNPSLLNVGDLSSTEAVILNNVPAFELPYQFIEALSFYVLEQGGGLLMTGGKQSFGAGGYFQSAIDDILPVSMELKEEHRKLSVAMAIVLDRSGSMGMGVGGAGLTKMDLANEGAARAVELLGPRDYVVVHAVDSKPHEFVPLTSVQGNVPAISSAIRRITSGGGGIYVFTGLDAAWRILARTKTGQRHIILFADAADAEEPGGYKQLLNLMSKSGGTVSVIGLGSDMDNDAEFLKDVAKRGGGRIFFSNDPVSIPNLFAQETVAVARSAFITDPVVAVATNRWNEIAEQSIKWLDSVDGYNLSYLKPDATAALLSGDEYNAPLIAFWQRGVGRAAAITFPISGEYSASARSWKDYSASLLTLSRWLIGDTLPSGVGLKVQTSGNRLDVDLLYADEWERRISESPPVLRSLAHGTEKTEEHIWERLEPGRYRSSIISDGKQIRRGVIQIGKHTIPFGPIVFGENAEWRFERARLLELEAISKESAGKKRVDLASVWDSPRKKAPRDLRHWYIVIALLLFLIDALLTKLGKALPVFSLFGFKLPTFSLPTLRFSKDKVEGPQEVENLPEKVQEAEISEAKTETSQQRSRSSLFDAAKKRGK